MALNTFHSLTFLLLPRPKKPNVIFVISTWISTMHLKLNTAKTEYLILLYLKYRDVHTHIYLCYIQMNIFYINVFLYLFMYYAFPSRS